ncbi:neuromedin-U receptor 1-like isoform X1 [Xyrichtys novacula]|uniref:Neuromedin-U receptor 1-like isoform X1 n=1 Tax=Xyrichtys novacula TaxID=13765 RepID=A0AAV1GFN6_XYRNO|nr:neuromedin-U receptor 1-like isoform X1 [Xyrichtys novacula]
MMESNCSIAGLFPSSATIFSGPDCPEVSVACGMNVSLVVTNATVKQLEVLCMSEEEYLNLHLGVRRSPEFLPVCIIYLTIFLAGVLGNSLTCAVILHYRVMQTPTNYYLLSLAVSDLLVLLLGMPLELYEMWQNYPFLLGEGGCYFKTFLFETVCFASILNVTALSVERYVAVVHPLKVKHMTTRARVKRMIFILWVLSMLCAVPNTSLQGIEELDPLFGRRFPQSAVCKVVKPPWMYNLIILISTLVFFLLPMLIISILYLLIGLQLRREKALTMVDPRGSFGPESLSKSQKQKLSKRNVQVTKMLSVLVIVFGLCWAPFHIDRLMWSYMDTSDVEHQYLFGPIHIVSGVFFYLSSAVNPILYNLMSTRFREMFRHITCFSKGWSTHSTLQMTQRSTMTESLKSI